MKNQVQLITYVDRFGGGRLRDLEALLGGPLAGLFGGVHLLPFYHPIDGADAGYDPIDHRVVDRRLGTWADVRSLSRTADVMADLIVNHMSSESPPFLDYSARGSASPYDGLFLTKATVFPHGATEQQLRSIYRPRPGLPFTRVTLKNGDQRDLWTTFTPQQVDIDVEHPQGRAYLESILQTFQANGITLIRLDAAGYAIKRPGTSCFMLPETYAFIADLTERARGLGVEALVEIHSHYEQQVEIARHVDRVYDFALPALVLHALYRGDADPLKTWLAIAPRNCVTVLDTHDGIGVMDVGADAVSGRPGLLPAAAIDELVETIHRLSRNESRQATGAAASNLDLYQVNCTYFDALGRDARAYLLARAIQFFAPGVPQVYYVGLLAGTNDLSLLARTRVGRDINRRYYSAAEVRSALATPVVQDLCDLIRWRNRHPAFQGAFRVLPTESGVLGLEWQNGDDRATLRADLRRREAIVTSREDGREVSLDLCPRSGNSSPA